MRSVHRGAKRFGDLAVAYLLIRLRIKAAAGGIAVRAATVALPVGRFGPLGGTSVPRKPQRCNAADDNAALVFGCERSVVQMVVTNPIPYAISCLPVGKVTLSSKRQLPRTQPPVGPTITFQLTSGVSFPKSLPAQSNTPEWVPNGDLRGDGGEISRSALLYCAHCGRETIEAVGTY